MAIFLYTDFGSGDLYVGQVKAVLHDSAPDIAVIDLLHDAPAFNVKANAHLLAALIQHIPADAVLVAVVDPGVGSPRRPVAVQADRRWCVGPDNGLLSVIAARAQAAHVYAIRWRPPALSQSFHGRDLFAPFAAMLAKGPLPSDAVEARPTGLEISLGGKDVPEIIYVDHFGNAMTGLRASSVGRERRLAVGGRRLAYARVYSDVKAGELFWYENSLGLVEVAVNGDSAAKALGARIGQTVIVE